MADLERQLAERKDLLVLRSAVNRARLRYQLIALTRGGAARLASPELVGQEGDLLYMAVRRDSRDELDSRLAEDGRHA